MPMSLVPLLALPVVAGVPDAPALLVSVVVVVVVLLPPAPMVLLLVAGLLDVVELVLLSAAAGVLDVLASAGLAVGDDELCAIDAPAKASAAAAARVVRVLWVAFMVHS
ncbi:MAG TPA: hypothetical protein VLJ86_20890 [Ramlibacter sp.]|nr:hypothetical protein [Ramlibacter sp.]